MAHTSQHACGCRVLLSFYLGTLVFYHCTTLVRLDEEGSLTGDVELFTVFLLWL